ncbi:MAG: hypothetical protein ACKVQW_00920 [Pyrinomonadaceae bacterium]
MSTNFHLAPPSKTVDGLLCVPIDIESIAATFTFDGATQTAVADATITYTVGPTAGNPIFDLRQNITSAWVDGAVFPVAQLAHHDFGTEPFTSLRVIEAVQTAGSVHTLRVQYDLAMPNSQLNGGYEPALSWLAGPKLHFRFGMSDLRNARYVEAFLPANLIFDQFSIDLEIQITGATAAHSVITNGVVTNIATNHWSLAFPSRFTALSPMLEIHASDRVTQQTDSILLPVSGNNVTIEAWKPTTSAIDLTAQINNIKTFLTNNENDYGAYVHGNRFVAFFNGGGMEYEGGTVTGTGPLLHETFHSWFARGIKPASQADGWWDEGFTEFHDDGANDAIPFDFTAPPILLCSRDPWQRHTPNASGASSYIEGNLFWKGIASQIGVGTLNNLMSDLYEEHKGNPVSTQMIEEFLLCRSGNEDIVDAFHRFIYGFGDPSPVPDLWLRDEVGDPGDDLWGGAFWDSPDLWIRNNDDGGTSHQEPEFGQDNWFHARVRNKPTAGTARHFVVTFNIPGFLATEFDYPDVFLPCIAAKADFELAAGNTRIVKAKWPRALIPPEGTHTCVLASVIARGDHPLAGRHVWEDNNLAQKNLTVVDLEANDTFFVLPIVIRNWRLRFDPLFELEVWRPKAVEGLGISLIHHSKDLFKTSKAEVRQFMPQFKDGTLKRRKTQIDCGGTPETALPGNTTRRLSSANPEAVFRRFPNSWEAAFSNAEVAKLAVKIPPMTQNVVGLKLAVTKEFRTKKYVKLHFVQRNVKTKQIVGGVAVQLRRVTDKKPK